MQSNGEREPTPGGRIEPSDATPDGKSGEAPEPSEPDPDHVVEEKQAGSSRTDPDE